MTTKHEVGEFLARVAEKIVRSVQESLDLPCDCVVICLATTEDEAGSETLLVGSAATVDRETFVKVIEKMAGTVPRPVDES